MSNINTTYALFDVRDYKNENVLSSYSLPITPLKFISDVGRDNFNEARVTFDMGDGTLINSTTAIHSYALPGVYTVRMIVKDCENNSLLGSYSVDVNITDYIENSFNIEFVSSDNINFPLSAGVYSDPVVVTNNTPYYQSEDRDVFYSVVSATIPNYFDLKPYKFNHLKQYNSFYKRAYSYTLSAYEYVETSKLPVSGTSVYLKLSNNQIIHTTSADPQSTFAGVSGYDTFYFRYDVATDASPIVIRFNKNNNKIYGRDKNGRYSLSDYSNQIYTSLSANVIATSISANAQDLSITSNGLTLEGSANSVFDISETQFKGASIPFCIQPQSYTDYTLKELYITETPNIVLHKADTSVVPTSSYTLSSLANTISGVDTSFWYYGQLKFIDSVSTVDTYYIAVTAIVDTSPLGSSSFTLTGTSSNFKIYPQNYYKFAKQNEDVDFTQIYKDLRFQEILLDKNVLFDDFIGSIVGNLSSPYNSLGKTVNERIFNFVSNNIDLDTCNIRSLISLSRMLNERINIYEPSLITAPPAITRLINTFSIAYNKLQGQENHFRSSFNNRGIPSSAVYGVNLGSELNALTATLSAVDGNIVALEKFSNSYTLLNLYQPVSSVGSHTYKLSDFSLDWGWPLVMPNTFTPSDLSKYYKFYEYVPGIEGTIFGSVFDNTNINHTLSYGTPLSAVRDINNIEDVMLRDTLFGSLSLFG